MTQLTLDLQIASENQTIPNRREIQMWAQAVITHTNDDKEVTVRVVDENEIQQLNSQFRHQDKLTNVLSFPADLPGKIEPELLGDIIICAPIVEKEALAQGKNVSAHWAHMVIHSMLHLLGYDHIEELDAQEMEQKEIELLATFNYPNPYFIEEANI